jgi:hypothetical protein
MALKNSGYCTTIVILLVSGLLGKRLDCNAGLVMYNRVIISQYEINKNTLFYIGTSSLLTGNTGHRFKGNRFLVFSN